MPCNTIQTSKVEFDLKHTDLNLFKLAMEKLGYSQQNATTYADVDGNVAEFTNGKLTQRYRYGQKLEATDIKVAYSKETVKYAAKKMGWSIESADGLKGTLKKKI